MALIRKMCIIKGIKSGFSQNGGPLSGVVRVETYNGRTTVDLSLINFAPLSDGRYLCILCDKEGERISFFCDPQGTSYSEEVLFSADKGFVCLIAFYRSSAETLAFGQYGGGSYNAGALLEGVVLPKNDPMPPPMPAPKRETEPSVLTERKIELVSGSDYDDEAISAVDYYGESYGADGVGVFTEVADIAPAKQEEETGQGAVEDETHTHSVFAGDGENYYLKIKDELEELFRNGTPSYDLSEAIPRSEWVKVQGSDVLVGLLRENFAVRYVAYALPTQTSVPPKELEKANFVPIGEKDEGYFVLFQDAETGETVRAGK